MPYTIKKLKQITNKVFSIFLVVFLLSFIGLLVVGITKEKVNETVYPQSVL